MHADPPLVAPLATLTADQRLPGAGGTGEWELPLNRYRVSVRGGGKVEIVHGYGSMTLGMCLMPLNCIL